MSGSVNGPGDICDVTGACAVTGANVPVNAAAGNVLTSDAAGNLSLQPPPVPASAAILQRVFSV